MQGESASLPAPPAAQYHRLARRMGLALVAAACSLPVIVYRVLERRANCRELGGDYFARWQHQTQQQRLIKRLEKVELRGVGISGHVLRAEATG